LAGAAIWYKYEWYVETTDADGNTTRSPTWRFDVNNLAPAAPNQSRVIWGDAPSELGLSASDGNGDALTYQVLVPP
jgi:hypothetical protein